jgi:hypothetical protein
MRKIVLILVSIAAVAVIGIAVFLSQVNTGGTSGPAENDTGTTQCEPRDPATPGAGETPTPDASGAPRDEGDCLNPGNEGKPGEARKG